MQNHSKNIKNKSILFFGILSFFVISIVVQTFSYVNSDSSWLLRCTQQLLDGGHYYTNFFETNPPLILWLNVPPTIAANFFHINVMFCFRVYLYLLIAASLLLCFFVLNKIFDSENKGYMNCILLGSAFVLLLLPEVDFGQREHFDTILALPYFFLVAGKLNNKKYSSWLSILIGVFAAVGFAIKPYFLIPWLMLEIYMMCEKGLKSVLRVETIIVAAFMPLYLLAIFYFTPNYIQKMLPMILTLYIPFGRSSIYMVVASNKFLFWLACLVLSFFYPKNSKTSYLINVLRIGVVGYLIVYAFPERLWFYHIMPAASFAIILLGLLFYESLQKMVKKYVGASVSYPDFILAILSAIFLLVIIWIAGHRANVAIYWRYVHQSGIWQVLQISKRFNYKGPALIVTLEGSFIEDGMRYGHLSSPIRTPTMLMFVPLMGTYHKNKSKKLMEAEQKIVQMFLSDIKRNKPGLIIESLREPKLFNFMLSIPQFKNYFDQFKPVGKFGYFKIYRRN